MRLLGFFSLAVTLLAHGDNAGKAVTLTATVVDTGCYMGHATTGGKHVRCATACARAGVPLALLDASDGALYLPVAMDHKNPNTRLIPFIERRVKVTGNVYEKGGLKGIVIKTVEAAK